jgi:hypothetical protein
VTQVKLLIAAVLAQGLVRPVPSAQQLSQPTSGAIAEIQTGRITAHMALLADDLLEGRETGTRGFDVAARYVASQFEEIGLRPIDGSYLQPMTIRRARLDEARSSLTIVHGTTREPLVYGRDFVAYGDTSNENVDVTGEIVFVGDGVTVNSLGIDAYRRVNSGGKIVVAMPGSPSGLSPSEASYFDDAKTKAANAADHDASALLLVEEKFIPWELRVRAARQLGSNEWLPAHRPSKVKTVAYISRPTAQRIFGQPLDQSVPRPGTVSEDYLEVSPPLHYRPDRQIGRGYLTAKESVSFPRELSFVVTPEDFTAGRAALDLSAGDFLAKIEELSKGRIWLVITDYSLTSKRQPNGAIDESLDWIEFHGVGCVPTS